MKTRWPFVGRSAELRTVLDALTGPGAALVGPPGVGKSRLAAEVVARLGHQVSRCYATVATSTIPFGALAALLPPDLPSANPLGRAVAHLRESGHRTLVVDDAHLLDDASVALLQHVIRHGHATVLLTARPGESTELHGLLPRFDVGHLSRVESDELLARALGHVDSHTTQLLWSCTAGNPLYLKELVISGRAVGRLVEHDGVWSWRGPIGVAGKLAEVVQANLGRLTPQNRAALEVLALAEPVELDVLTALAAPAVLDDLESRGLLRVELSGRRSVVRLGHPLYGTLLRETCPTLRAQAHQRALADRLEATGARRREDLMRIATWRLNSNTPTSASMLATAAEQAWMARDSALAERLCRAAIDAGGAAEAGPVFGQVLMYAREPDEAERMLAEIMSTTTDPVDRARLGEIRAANLFFGLARAADAAELLDSVNVPSLPDEMRAWLRSIAVAQQVQHQNIAVVAARNAELPDNLYTRQTRGLCQLHSGQYADMVLTVDSYAAEALAVADRFPVVHHSIQLMRCFAHMATGAFADAEQLASQVLAELVHDSRWAFTETSIYAVLAYLNRMRGHTDKALRLAREGARVRNFGEHPLIFDAMVLGELAATSAMQGLDAEAYSALDRAASSRRPAWVATGLSLDLAHATVLGSTGDVASAGAVALATADAMHAQGMLCGEVSALHHAARFGVDTAGRLGVLAASLDDPFTAACAAHAAALASESPAAFEAVSRSFAVMGATVYAAEALASAAALHRRAGRSQVAAQVSARQALLMRDFDVVHTPGLVVDRVAHLTPRQVEVAQLAASGLTNQQIAAKLHTSKRTVDNHLHAVYTSLGVSGREGLREVFSPEVGPGPG